MVFIGRENEETISFLNRIFFIWIHFWSIFLLRDKNLFASSKTNFTNFLVTQVVFLRLLIKLPMKKSVIILLFAAFTMSAQIKGNVTDKEGAPLSSVSVYLDNTFTGTTTNNNGDYNLTLKKSGKYAVIFQIIGFTTLKKEVNITSFPFELDVVLEEENVQLKEIVISTKDNPANRIIRNVIANKDKNTDKYRSESVV